MPNTQDYNFLLSGNGKAFYEACLAFHTSTNLTAEEIHQQGLDEVDRIEAEMREIITELGYNYTLQEFIEFVRNDKNNFFTTPKDLLDAFKDILENRINPRLLDLFHTKPATRLEIVEVANQV